MTMFLFPEIYELFSEAAYEFSEQSKKWMPKWITEHKKLQDIKDSRLFKVFHAFGLKDFRQPIQDPHSIEDFIDFLTSNISSVVSQLMRLPDTTEATRLEQVSFRLVKELARPEIWQQHSHKLLTNIFSDDKKIRIDAGTSVIKAYNLIKTHAAKLNITIPNIEASQAFKDYGKRGAFTIVFSTNPEDIAAMASRSEWGSCQTIMGPDEPKGMFNVCVLGSMLSKFVGICYITTGKPYGERGEEMLARCLVRFIVDMNTNRPAIVLDKMWPKYTAKFGQEMIASLQSRISIPVINQNILTPQEAVGRFKRPYEEMNPEEETYIDERSYYIPTTRPKKENESDLIANPYNFIDRFVEQIVSIVAHELSTELKIPIDYKQMTDFYDACVFLVESIITKIVKSPAESIFKHYDRGGREFPIGFVKRFLLKKLKEKESQQFIMEFMRKLKFRPNVAQHADQLSKMLGTEEDRMKVADIIIRQLQVIDI